MIRSRLDSLLRRPVAAAAALVLAAAPAAATWSICVLDTRTGEVVVAGATCIPDFYLPQPIACVAVGKGCGASQSFVLHNAKGWMYEGFQNGDTPDQILAFIQANGTNLPVRQIGIVGLEGPPVTYTGNGCGAAATGVAGTVGDLRYAIQGNVLSDESVVFAAEQALLTASGDLGQRVMEAMEVAAAFGGDGRCSCPGGAVPCGNPTNFSYSAYTSFLIVARHGDTDSTTCAVTNNNCSNGDYYGLVTFEGNNTTSDPVDALRRKYELWRAGLEGRADHFRTEVTTTADILRADGQDAAFVDVALVDVDGRPVTVGGQTLLVTAVEDPGVTISAVTDNGDGTHSFQVTGGTSPGTARLRVVVQDGVRDVRLWPDLEVRVAPAAELFHDRFEVSASSGGLVRFDVETPTNPGGTFQLLGSGSGTSPGTPFGSLTVPLVRDRLFELCLSQPNGLVLPASQGSLDASGEATAWFDAAPGILSGWVGRRLDFVVFQAGPPGAADRVTNGVFFDVVP
jgi:uncharacterized Ntn-hydrolase superfamily protein